MDVGELVCEVDVTDLTSELPQATYASLCLYCAVHGPSEVPGNSFRFSGLNENLKLSVAFLDLSNTRLNSVEIHT